MELHEIKHLLDINPHKLDAAITQHPALQYEISLNSARANAAKDLAKDAIAVADSRKDLEIREEAVRDGVKITESRVKSCVAVSKEHIDAHTLWVEASTRAAEWLSAKEAVCTKAFLIRDLVQLSVNDLIGNRSNTIKGGEGAITNLARNEVNKKRNNSK